VSAGAARLAEDAQGEVDRFACAVGALRAETWQAWKMGERESRVLALDEPETLDEAVQQAMARCCPYKGDRLAVLRTHAGRGKRTLWLFAVKQSTRVFDYRAATDGGRPVRVGRFYPELLIQTEVAAFAPVETFDAFRDDPVGRDAQLVETAS